MKIGFTGTQQGMTEAQKQIAQIFIAKCPKDTEFHHGDCIGADSDFHDLISHGYKVVIHPPDNNSKRAFKQADEIRQPKPYLDRNKNIVNEIDELIATPKEFNEQRRSGTWSTIRYAKKIGKRVTIIYPNGNWLDK